MNVLIVEDNADDRRLLRQTFEHHGCTVVEAKNGKEGLDMAAAHRPDIIVSDALMPVMDGFLLLRALKADQELWSIPLVFYSATYTGQNEVELASALGAEAFMLKPKEPEELWNEVCKVFQTRKLMKEAAVPAVGEGEEQFLREYSQIVAAKLEIKMKELEEELARRKESEEALLESEQKYRQLSEALEERVQKGIDELRLKDKLLIIQSRQAVMGEMLSNIAHQWRQPLNMLGLLAQDMQMTQEMTGLSREYVEANVKKTLEIILQMSKTIDDFRYFFKPETEKVEFRVSETIQKTLSLLEGSFQVLGIRTEVHPTGDPLINGYPGEFIQVLLNILINARDALTARKVGSPKINITLSAQGDKTVVSIADNAGGIAEEIKDKIFEPYFTTKGPDQGTGIGLFMCKTIVEKNMKGKLSVSNVGDGAEFRIEV